AWSPPDPGRASASCPFRRSSRAHRLCPARSTPPWPRPSRCPAPTRRSSDLRSCACRTGPNRRHTGRSASCRSRWSPRPRHVAQRSEDTRLNSSHLGISYAVFCSKKTIMATEAELSAVGLGGTAVGTGLTAHPRFHVLVVRELSRLTGLRLRPAPSTVTAAWSLRPLLACSGALRGLAVDLGKICFDLRLLASGPRAGLGELSLPEVEP